MRMINTINEHLAKIWLLGSMVIVAYLHSTGDPLTFAGYVGLGVGWVSLCMRSPIEEHSGYATIRHSHTNELKSTDLDARAIKHEAIQNSNGTVCGEQVSCQHKNS